MSREAWETVCFGDVAREVKDTEQDPLAKGITRYVGLADLDPDSIQLKRWSEIANGETTFTRLFRKGQMLFGRRRAYQRKAAVAPFDGICSGDIIVMEAKPDKLLPELLPFLIHTDGFFDYAIQTSAGSLSPRTKWSHLAKYEFALPSLDEQRRIVELLVGCEKVLINHYFALEKARLMHRVNIAQLFLYGIPSAHTRFQETRLGEIPDSWQTVPLKNITTKIVDGVHKTPKYTRDGIPFITVENLTRGEGIDFANTRFISCTDHEQFKKRAHPQLGDVLVSKDGTLGVARVVETNKEFSIFVSVALLKPDHDRLDPHYLRAFFDSTIFQRNLLKRSSGSALKHIHLVDFRSTLIPLPPMKEQKQIAQLISLSGNAVRSLNSHVERLQTLKRGLLIKLME